ncbi:MAG TPA: class I SAM-dependent methyltransferase [Solirubrobacteraceae bacterium]
MVETIRRQQDELERFLASVGDRAGPDLTHAELARLEELIRAALRADYTSASCKDGIETGNHYQSVRLGDTRTEGFRTDRRDFLDLVDFRGRAVLDLGSNLGELSRSARARGAVEVCGIEYDPWFLTVARAINVFNGVTGVRFVRGDITDPTTLEGEFDIVLAFAVFTYIEDVLARVAEVTRELLLLETHNLDGNLERDYLAPTTRWFPHARVLGTSDWGRDFRPTEGRAVIAFAKEAATLERMVRAPARPVRSPRTTAARGTPAQLDVVRTSQALHGRFFSTFTFASADDLCAAVASLDLDVEAFSRSREAPQGYSGWLYWLLLLKGWLGRPASGEVTDDDVFLAYWLEHHLAHVEEPGRSDERDREEARTALERRYADLDALRRWSDGGRCGPTPPMRAVRLIVSDAPGDQALRIALVGREEPLLARSVDGWHRIFAARLFGIGQLACEVLHERYPLVHGDVQRMAYDGETLELDGWLLNDRRAASWYEVRAGGRTLCRRALRARPDVVERFPDVPHAGRSGFAATCACTLTAADLSTLEVLAMEDWLPVGRLVVRAAR